MTVLIGWIGVDSRVPCSAYLMSDSRISWNDQLGAYDYGRKLFAFKNSPDILGYCGDVTFPSMVLSRLSFSPVEPEQSSIGLTEGNFAFTISH